MTEYLIGRWSMTLYLKSEAVGPYYNTFHKSIKVNMEVFTNYIFQTHGTN